MKIIEGMWKNKPTFTANDRAVLDLIVDLEQVSKEVNPK